MKKFLLLIYCTFCLAASYAQITNSAPYCMPVMGAGYKMVTSVNLKNQPFTIVDNGGFWVNHYIYYNTTVFPDFVQGENAPVQIVFDAVFDAEPIYFALWIDYNQNNTFESSELVMQNSNTNMAPLNPGTAYTINKTITIPAGALTGTTRVRLIRSQKPAGPNYFIYDPAYTLGPCPNGPGFALYGCCYDFNMKIVSNGGPVVPVVSTEAATNIVDIAATLKGTVLPNNINLTGISFEYGTTAAYGSSAAGNPNIANGATAVNISANVAGLTANTLYHYRIKAVSATATYYGSDMTFTTLAFPLPVATTTAATAITNTTATLNGIVSPNGNNVGDIFIEYGLTNAYGTSAAANPHTANGTTAVNTSADIAGLTANTVYHYRLLFTANTPTFMTYYGADMTFTTSAIPVAPTAISVAATNITTVSATLNGTVSPNNNNVSAISFEYGTTAAYGSAIAGTPAIANGAAAVNTSANIAGLTANTLYHYRVKIVSNAVSYYSADRTFTTAAIPVAPTATAVAATNITTVSATLNGTVSPNNNNVTAISFEYGITAAYGNSVAGNPAVANGAAAVNTSANIAGLTANTLYHYRVKIVSNAVTYYSADMTFTTSAIPVAPTAISVAATNITTVSATLNGTVSPNNNNITAISFEYGTTAAYGSTVAGTPAVANGATAVNTSANIAGLTANTLYHYRVKIVSNAVTYYSADMTFTTVAIPVAPTATSVAATNITTVSATLNGTVSPNNNNVSAVSFEYGTTAAYGNTIAGTPAVANGAAAVNTFANIAGLTANTLYHYRVKIVANTVSYYSADITFTTLAVAAPVTPTALSVAATNITLVSARLNGTVSPNSNNVSAISFEYGTTAVYGNSIGGTPAVANGAAAVNTSANIAGLTANTLYHYRVKIVSNAVSYYSTDMTFTTKAGTVSNGGVVIYPVPFRQVFYIDLPIGSSFENQQADINIYDPTGKLCFTNSRIMLLSNKVELPKLAVGVYTLFISGNAGHVVKHILRVP